MIDYKALFAVTITASHFGVGRAPGTVDLPIARDPIGYPIIPASGLKGALKNACAKGSIDGESGRVNCGEAKCCCCLFGPEPGESGSGASAASLTDFVLFAMPVPSPSHGWLYATTPFLLMRAASLLDSMGKGDLAEKLVSVANEALSSPIFLGTTQSNTEVRVLGKKYKVKSPSSSIELPNLPGLASKISYRLLIVPDEDGPAVIDRGIMRYWRVKLNHETKTVDKKFGALWSEEYIPAGAVFVGGIALVGSRNSYCKERGENVAEECFNEITEDLFGNGSKGRAIFVGGKESIGKGLVRIVSL